jgi:hypothetical protein
MAYTFLPHSERSSLNREYHVRVAIVLLFFMSVALIVGVGALFPAYIHASFEEKLHLRDMAALKLTSDGSSLSTVEKNLSSSTDLMSLLAVSTTQQNFSTAISDIASARGNVKVSSFGVTRVASSTLSIVIGGLAPTRSALLAFKARLDSLAPGISVTLPVSELARDTDIQFSIQIVE